ncbi:unnamed protein product [Nesidiocoris tenuis]|uniref:Uncharacterized protein n=1 Tax=Nesidiocoris tenuis TaxID=355587 RepID=A0A6H5HN20_9HEMI|nr:unnamed protein product [Nesidiocoris tenuis]
MSKNCNDPRKRRMQAGWFIFPILPFQLAQFVTCFGEKQRRYTCSTLLPNRTIREKFLLSDETLGSTADINRHDVNNRLEGPCGTS